MIATLTDQEMDKTNLTDQKMNKTNPNNWGELNHFWCCDIDIAMCGLDISKHDIRPEPDYSSACKVCLYIDDNDLPCPVLGCGYQNCRSEL